MSPTSAIPYLIFSCIFLLFSNYLVKNNIFFKKLIQNSNRVRYQSIDGLRGFLALGVFFHHSVISYYYFHSGIWKVPPSPLYRLLGEGAVSFFFMITAFLFWSKAISKGGKFNVKDFYKSRLLRLYPMYLFSLIVIFFVVAFNSNFSLKVDLFSLTSQAFHWAVCGLLGFPNMAVGFPDLNGVETSIINANIAWSLTCEWIFYLLLPLLALLLPFLAILNKTLRFILLSIGLFMLYKILPNFMFVLIINFLFGIAAAYIVSVFDFKKTCSKKMFSIVPMLILIGMPFVLSSGFNILASTLIFILLLSFIYGNNLFGLLTSPASIYLGKVSYSIYLLHGIILYLALHIINTFLPIKILNPTYYWFIISGCGLAIIWLSGFTYYFVEHPFINYKS